VGLFPFDFEVKSENDASDEGEDRSSSIHERRGVHAMRKAAGHRRGMVLAIGLALALLPLKLHVADGRLDLATTAAAAKDGGKGGKGGGNEGGGNEGGGNQGGGKGGGKQGGAKSGDSDAGGKGGGKSAGKTKDAATPARATPADDPAPGLEVVHRNGILERISRGRYEMKDSRGRTIINRVATNADQRRLVQLVARPQS
jgi:hypothetical protein